MEPRARFQEQSERIHTALEVAGVAEVPGIVLRAPGRQLHEAARILEMFVHHFPDSVGESFHRLLFPLVEFLLVVNLEQGIALYRCHRKELSLESEFFQLLVPIVQTIRGSRSDERLGIVEIVLVNLLGLFFREVYDDDVVLVFGLGLHTRIYILNFDKFFRKLSPGKYSSKIHQILNTKNVFLFDFELSSPFPSLAFGDSASFLWFLAPHFFALCLLLLEGE